MPELKNCVAVDWRSGKDAIHFFFKDTETYSRFNMGSNEVPDGYPRSVYGRWRTFEPHVKDLRFGFTVTGLDRNPRDDSDVSWLFYKAGNTPMVCGYDQDIDAVTSICPVKDSGWSSILPYFDDIVAATWWENESTVFEFRFIMRSGISYRYDYASKTMEPLKYGITSDLRRLEAFKNRIVTAAQYDRTFDSSIWYIFLINNQYMVYDMFYDRVTSGPHDINDDNWPGLLRD